MCDCMLLVAYVQCSKKEKKLEDKNSDQVETLFSKSIDSLKMPQNKINIEEIVNR